MTGTKRALLRAALAVLMTALLPATGGTDSRVWPSIAKDGLRDPASPAVPLLQNPAEALRPLPRDTAGNLVDWMTALREGHIEPRASILPGTDVRTLDQDIYMPRTGDADVVRFPHLAHTEWLDCDNCHDRIFASETGATPLTMFAILQGEYCGQCHGAVAFPLTECRRCHSVPWQEYRTIVRQLKQQP